jgi:hypothetical protein
LGVYPVVELAVVFLVLRRISILISIIMILTYIPSDSIKILTSFLAPVAHVCNPSYVRSWDWENHSSRPAMRPPSPKQPEQNGPEAWLTGRVSLQVWSPKFTSYFHLKKKKDKEFLCLYNLTSICYFLSSLMIAILTGMRW